MTIVAPNMEEVRVAVAASLRIVIAFVWLGAAAAKYRAAPTVAIAVDRLLRTPRWATTAVARALPYAEGVLGIAMLLPPFGRTAALLSATLFVAFAFLLGRAAVRDASAEGGCGCFGARSRTWTGDPDAAARAIARNLVFATFAVAAIY